MRILYSHLAIVFFTVLAVIICVSLYMNVRRIQQSAITVQKIEIEVANIEAKVNKVESTALEATSAAAKERIFRDELLLQRSGEYIVQVPDQPVPTLEQAEQTLKLTPWRQWRKLLF